ncbi:MAG: nucleotidyltransferase domain-containing protein [Rikenellaceae bacterium]|jgi:predicted nucleotidyltransferase|nr:nucleotidyltransferase domain-containing protein [Rikenellaceae bacterium]
MNPIIAQHLPELLALCKKNRVATMYLFGSATTGAFNEKSDFDFLIAFEEGLSFEEYGDNYFELAWALEDLLGRDVDLVTENSLSNPYFIASVNRTKQLIYAAA